MKVLIEPSEKGLTVIIPPEIAEASQLRPGTEVDIWASTGQIILSAPPALTLDELLEGMTPENRHPETDWGPPVGKEVW